MKIVCYKYRENGKYYKNGVAFEPSDTTKLLSGLYGLEEGVVYEAHPYYELIKTEIISNTKKSFTKIYNLQLEFDKIELYPENDADILCDIKIIY